MMKPVYSLLLRNRSSFILLTMLLFSCASGAFGQVVTYDAIATSAGSTSFTTPSTATWAHTCTGNDRVLVVSIAQDKGFNGTNEVVSITYANMVLTKQVQTSNGNYEAELWYLIAPATGTNNIVMTCTSPTINYVATSISFTNAQQTPGSLIGDTNGGTGNSATTTGATAAVSTSASDMVINNFVYRGFATSPAISGTLDARNIAQASFGQIWGGCQTKQGTGSAISSQYDWLDQTSNEWAVSSMVLRSTTACSQPTTQASTISFDAETETSIDLSWVRGNGDRVLVVCKAGTAPSGPADGVTYTASATLGVGDDVGSSSYAVYDGTGSSVTVTGLTAGTEYYFEISEYSTAGPCYKQTPEDGSHATACAQPGTQASAISFDVETATTIDLSWVRGDGDNVLVVCKTGSAPTAPAGGLSYTANAVFASGDDVGANSYAVYDGTGTSATVTDLAAGTDYYFEIWEYNAAGSCYKAIPESGNHITSCDPPITQASGISFDAATYTTLDLSWVRGDGDNVLVVCKTGSAPTDPTNGTSYTANAVFTAGDDVGSSSYAVYDGTGTSVVVAGLAPATLYYFEIWEYSAAGSCYKTTPEEGSESTVLNTSYDELNKVEHFTVFPNPAIEEFMYSFSGFDKNVQVELFSISGQLIKHESVVSVDGKYQGTFSINDLATGLYIVKISDGKNASQLKLSKQ
jgi:hypothetical protein